MFLSLLHRSVICQPGGLLIVGLEVLSLPSVVLRSVFRYGLGGAAVLVSEWGVVCKLSILVGELGEIGSVWTDFSKVLRGAGSFCVSGQVRSVCVPTELLWVFTGCTLVDAAVAKGCPFLGGACDQTIFRASAKDTPVSALTCCTFFLSATMGSPLRKQHDLHHS